MDLWYRITLRKEVSELERLLGPFTAWMNRRRADRDAAAAAELEEERVQQLAEGFYALFSELEGTDPVDNLVLMGQMEQTCEEEEVSLQDVVRRMFSAHNIRVAPDHGMYGYTMTKSRFEMFDPNNVSEWESSGDVWYTQTIEAAQRSGDAALMTGYRNDLLRDSRMVFGDPEHIVAAYRETAAVVER
ncbi:hypothetical protein HY469_00440 [Candidatus Roizmanbacteria bacterium]|nr:hypothetical protein [Candidatus Roizmanbacteria bacterium]